jgi:hypothetical protein
LCARARAVAAIDLDGNRPPGIAGRLSRRPLRGGKVDICGCNRRARFSHRERGAAADPGPAPVTNTT